MTILKINILHTSPSMGINYGGPTTCIYFLLKGLINNGVNLKIITFNPAGNDTLISDESFIQPVKRPYETRFGFSQEFKSALNQYKNSDIIHANVLWQYSTHASSVFGRRNKIPYIISTHGMLYPEGLKKSALFKKIALPLYQRKDLEKATVIHATCTQEMKYIRQLGFKNPIAVIPNAIEIKIPPKIAQLPNKEKQIGFLGRFAPIKNIEILLEAWASTSKNNPDWELILIGDGEPAYKNSLIQLTQKLEIKNIRFTGFLTGNEKEIALQNLSYLVLPSKSENFGMVVPEALIREIPVIASKGTPWAELNTRKAGWWIEVGAQPLAETLTQAMRLSEAERQTMGQNGRKLVAENYSIEAITSQMIELYDWVLGRVEQPSFVRLD